MTVVDTDGHITEPLDNVIWEHYLEKPFRGRPGRPGWVQEPNGEVHFHYGGRRRPPIASSFVGLRNSAFHVRNDVRAGGGVNPHVRVKAMDHEGIDVAVLYPGATLTGNFELDEGPVAAAYCRAYNNWLADFCRPYPNRLKGVGIVPLHDVNEAIKEAARCVKDLGFVAIVVPTSVLGDAPGRRRPLSHPDFYPFYEKMQELDTPITTHTMPPLPPLNWWEDLTPTRFTHHQINLIYPSQVMLMHLITGGVLEKFPQLRIAFNETGVGWVPWWLDRMDDQYERDTKVGINEHPLMIRKPSESVRQGQVYFACEVEEKLLPYCVASSGEDKIIYASDYPHLDSKTPNTVKILRGRTDLSESAKRKILGENAHRLFRLTYSELS